MENVQIISAERITDPVNPMRTEMDRAALWDLAESIKREGLINPITVRPKGEMFEVVAGHRRFTACKIAGTLQIACVIRELTDDQANDIMAHENLQRADIDPVDEAIFLGRMVGEDTSKVPEIARRLNRGEAWVWSRLEILEYPEIFLPYVKSGELKLGVATWLAKIKSEHYQKQYLDLALQHGMSVRQAQYLFSQWDLGLAPEPSSVLPAASDTGTYIPPKAKAPCARCGKLAIEPNLTLVYIHQECSDEGQDPPPAAV